MRKHQNNEEMYAAKLEIKKRKKSLKCNLGVKQQLKCGSRSYQFY